MAQNINLLEELTVSPISTYNCKLMMHLAIGWILLLTLIYAVALTIHLNQKKTVGGLEEMQKNITTKTIGYKQELATLNPEYMSNSSSLLGFYRYLEDLAKFTPQGIWFKEITFSEPDGNVMLKGSTIIASGISTLLNSLHKSQSLDHKKFSTLQLVKNVESDNIDFTINNIIINNQETNKTP